MGSGKGDPMNGQAEIMKGQTEITRRRDGIAYLTKEGRRWPFPALVTGERLPNARLSLGGRRT